jgi:hypothetical protein
MFRDLKVNRKHCRALCHLEDEILRQQSIARHQFAVRVVFKACEQSGKWSGTGRKTSEREREIGEREYGAMNGQSNVINFP